MANPLDFLPSWLIVLPRWGTWRLNSVARLRKLDAGYLNKDGLESVLHMHRKPLNLCAQVGVPTSCV